MSHIEVIIFKFSKKINYLKINIIKNDLHAYILNN